MTPSDGPMKSGGSTCRRIAFPAERRLVLDTLHLGHRKPMMHGLIELDVTRSRPSFSLASEGRLPLTRRSMRSPIGSAGWSSLKMSMRH
jgi:hypothetical protein